MKKAIEEANKYKKQIQKPQLIVQPIAMANAKGQGKVKGGERAVPDAEEIKD